jgi:hypothetical protein
VENWAHTVATKWKTEGVKTNEPATPESISQVEAALDFTFPNDFKELYLEINGFEYLDWQEHMFSLWSLERIVDKFSESKDNDFIGFCDFFLSANYIGFRKSEAGIFKIYRSINEKEDEPIAQSFKQVIDLINTSTGSIY